MNTDDDLYQEEPAPPQYGLTELIFGVDTDHCDCRRPASGADSSRRSGQARFHEAGHAAVPIFAKLRRADFFASPDLRQ